MADTDDVGHAANLRELVQQMKFAVFGQLVFEFVRRVEKILDRVFTATGDQNDVFNSGLNGLFDDIKDNGRVDDGQHLFGDGFGGGEEPCSESGRRNDGFPNLRHHLGLSNVSKQDKEKIWRALQDPCAILDLASEGKGNCRLGVRHSGECMEKRTFRLVSLACASLALMMSFQNCGKAGFDGAQMEENFASSLKSGLPFAFEASFDQVSYNSCFGAGLSAKPGFFTLQAGAYDTGGVKITPDFKVFAKTSGVIRPEYPATEVTDDQVKVALAQSDTNVETVPQMALRSRSNVQQVRTPGGSSPTIGFDIISMLDDLTDDRWMDPLVRQTAVTSFFNLAPEAKRRFEAKVSYNNDEAMAQFLRDDLSTSGMMALTFKQRSDLGGAQAARSPSATDSRVAYGKGYFMTFEKGISPYTRLYGQANPQPHLLNPNNLLTQIQEVDLKNPSVVTGTWTCPEVRRYLVVRLADKAAYCPPDPYSAMLTGANGMSAADYRREYEIIRRHLKPEYWDVSVTLRCAVPKDGNCYPNEVLNGQPVAIEYDQTQPCFQALPDVQYSSVPTKRCAQYVSVCTR